MPFYRYNKIKLVHLLTNCGQQISHSDVVVPESYPYKKKVMSGVPFLCYFWQMGYNNLYLLMQIDQSHYQLAFPRRSFDLKSETSTEGDQNENIYEHLSHSHAASSHFSSKAKTSLCKNYTSKGACPYGKKCQFAHGPQQLRINMEHNRSYKTKVCHAFQKEGFCCFGERCNFIHHQSKSSDVPQQRWRQIYLNHRSTISPPEFNQSSRLLNLLH